MPAGSAAGGDRLWTGHHRVWPVHILYPVVAMLAVLGAMDNISVVIRGTLLLPSPPMKCADAFFRKQYLYWRIE